MGLCKFGQNPSIGSGDADVTLFLHATSDRLPLPTYGFPYSPISCDAFIKMTFFTVTGLTPNIIPTKHAETSNLDEKGRENV